MKFTRQLAKLVIILGFLELLNAKLTVKSMAQAHKKELFEQWMKKFGKLYGNEVEYKNRFKIWQQNLLEVNEHNLKFAQNLVTYTKGMNQFSDITKEEFSSMDRGFRFKGYKKPQGNETARRPTPRFGHGAIPENHDWRPYDAVMPVKDQGDCGSCWAFAAAGTVEGQLALNGFPGKFLSVSVQQAMECSSYNGCDGGLAQWAYQAWQGNSIASYDDYPYKEEDTGECRAGNLGYVEDFWRISSESALQEAVAEYGPVAVGVAASTWKDYFAGIFEDDCSGRIDHMVLVVGYSPHWWVVKNSWGIEWGQWGYIYLPKGVNICGIGNEGVIATLKK